MATLLARTDAMLREGRAPGATVWPTGFGRLDGVLGGGVRSGELALIAGSQGQGKTTFGLQMLRQVATIGRPAVFFSFEHESHTLLERLLAMEGAYAADADPQGLSPADVGRVRAVFEQVDAPGASLASMMGVLPRGAAALAAVEAYAQRLHLHESSPTTDVLHMARVVEQVAGTEGIAPLVLVDYLQKVPAVGADEGERTTAIVEGLKDMALEFGAPVVAISAADKERLGAGQRMRAEHLRGSSSLAYESDIVLVLADKADIVAREHLVYDLTRMDRYREWVVVSVEKNRHGNDNVVLEFEKDFAHGRFHPEGRPVEERLIEERVFRE
ncbi:MAG: DnaB-like helicase C-terminal domain-containing protein [Dermatophilaceae bacterium]